MKTARKRGTSAPPSGAGGGTGTERSMRVLRRFRVLFNSVKTHFRAVEKTVGIGGAQLWALSVVRDRPDIAVGDLARELDVHQSTASNLVRALVARGLVATQRHEEDRRAVRLRLRPEGARVLRQAPAPFTGVLPDALAALDERTLARLERDLGKLIEVLEADEAAANVPLGIDSGGKRLRREA